MTRFALIFVIVLTLTGCSHQTELEQQVDSVHFELMGIFGVPEDLSPDDASPGFGDNMQRLGQPCGGRGSKTVNFAQASPERKVDAPFIVDFGELSPKQQAETVAQHLIDNDWVIQRYVSDNGGHNIIGNRLRGDDSIYLRLSTSDGGGYNARVEIVLDCTRFNEGPQRTDWTAVDSFPSS